jgi:hypothetical protein
METTQMAQHSLAATEPTIGERQLLADYTRIEREPDGYRFEVGVVTWAHPHEPDVVWKCFRHWKSVPTPARLAAAEKAALATARFFRQCVMCGELNNAGHMHDAVTCQSCAERHYGVVY